MENHGKSEAVRLLKWIRNNREDWDLICALCNGEEIDDDKMYRLLNIMRNEAFYQIAMILLSSCVAYQKSEQALFGAFVDTLLEKEAGDGIEQYFQRVIEGF